MEDTGMRSESEIEFTQRAAIENVMLLIAVGKFILYTTLKISLVGF
jgi:hypothetical protein